MNLLVFAHRGEAKAFLHDLKFKSVKNYDFLNVYKNENDYLIICGEGIQSATEFLASVLAVIKNEITMVINLGVAGALDQSLELNKIYSVQTAYAEKVSQEMQFKSFSSRDSEAYYDCVSALKRVLDDENANYLSKFAQIVDRELWAIGSVAKLFKIPFQSYKLISDYAGSNTSCFDISNKTDFYSQHLLEFYLEKNIKILNPEQSEYIPDGFYFTTAQKRTYKNVYERLSRKLELKEDELFSYLNVKQILVQDIQAKQKTKILLEKMQDLLSPFETILDKKIAEIFKDFKGDSIQVQLQNDLEKENFNILAKIKNQTDFNNLKNAVNHFDYKAYIDFLNGKK